MHFRDLPRMYVNIYMFYTNMSSYYDLKWLFIVPRDKQFYKTVYVNKTVYDSRA